jgi:hypothetical protein
MNENSFVIKNFHDRLDYLQFNRSFDDCKFLLVDQMVHGFGGQISRRMLGLQLGYMFDRTVVFKRPDDPPYALCLKPTSSYTYDDIKEINIATFTFSKDQKDKVAFFDFDAFWRDEDFRIPFYSWLPEDFKQAGYDRYIYDGQILARLKWLDEYKEYVENAKKRIGYENPIIAMHIRRGDKYTEAPYIPLPVYFNELKKASKESGIKKVFVTSDSDETIQELLRIDSDFEFIYDDMEPRYNNANHAYLRRNPDLAKQETQTAIKILELIASADRIVGPDNAHLTTLGVAINSARLASTQNRYLIPGDLTSSRLPLKYRLLVAQERFRQHIMLTKNRRWYRRFVYPVLRKL